MTGSVQPRVIAIDGPAGAGKSTVAKEVAARLGLAYLDTGAMYRAVALAALRRGVDPAKAAAVATLAREIELVVEDRVLLDGTDATTEIRSPEVTAAVSIVAANPAVRTEMRTRQQMWARARGGGVVEGRDIGTVVFPEAMVKVYLTAASSVRAQRRLAEVGSPPASLAGMAADMARRDELDSQRSASPLAVATDAVVIDTTDRTVAEVADAIIGLLG